MNLLYLFCHLLYLQRAIMTTVMRDKKDYKVLENYVVDIYKNHIALPKEAVDINNKVLDKVLKYFEQKMKEKDELFKYLYQNHYFGGSYYDGSKISHPNEYDIDLLFCIRKNLDVRVQSSKRPGFVYVYYKPSDSEKDSEIMRKLGVGKKLMDNENYLSTEKVYHWLESVIQRCMNELPKDKGGQYIEFDYKDEIKVVYIKLHKGKPAFTLKLKMESYPEISVDLVGCFLFNNDQWPNKNDGYRKNPIPSKPNFFVVPKSPKNIDSKNLDRYWRLSFQEQEKQIMAGDNFKSLKPALKIIKKIRDKYNHPVASYFIKTVFLWTIEDKANDTKFWHQPLATVFMEMLKIYSQYMQDNNIPYYWNKRFNLLVTVQNAEQIGKTLKNMTDDIDRNLTRENILENYILNKEELKLRMRYLKEKPSVDEVDLSQTVTQLEKLKLDENKQISEQIQNANILKILERLDNRVDQLANNIAKLESNVEDIKHSLASLIEQKSARFSN
ncbi:hypothetical protein GWI33_006775 [Rhynchophorus ferrugineus]|uniref:Uncharacterized protein n=1 Tax=Rhynchophorus ferrugineus TaxID=354439 RepID=A0A834IIK6_RHYFE|nr:hypothetical protein GWI33_006775 [Rhynchophorus ferrugineus]